MHDKLTVTAAQEREAQQMARFRDLLAHSPITIARRAAAEYIHGIAHRPTGQIQTQPKQVALTESMALGQCRFCTLKYVQGCASDVH